jgi:hypothetical protein
MRIHGWCATALAAASLTTAQTVTITRTVERVVATSWATSSYASSSAWGSSNATHLATGTGSWPSSSASMTHTVLPATGAAAPIRLDTLGYAVVAGLAGFVAL